MHKTLANAITVLIPYRMTRHRWRGILMYGPIRAIKLLSKLRRGKDTPTYHYLAVCATVKNEGPYFAEWIEWHRRMGFEKFYIYDNESSDNTKEILAPYVDSGLVEYIFWEGKGQQLAIYNDCLDRHRLDVRWIAAIDIDEFIVTTKDKTLPELLKRFEQFPIVEINWLVYGSGGIKKKEEGSVMDRFKKHSAPDHILNRHVKSIVNPRRVFAYCGAHVAASISGRAADSLCEPIKAVSKERQPQHDVIRINHYAVKSYEEFLMKRARGRASRVLDQYGADYFHRYDLNDSEKYCPSNCDFS